MGLSLDKEMQQSAGLLHLDCSIPLSINTIPK